MPTTDPPGKCYLKNGRESVGRRIRETGKVIRKNARM